MPHQINLRKYSGHVLIGVVIVVLTFIWCEWLVYHVVIGQCVWPVTDQPAASVLKVRVFARFGRHMWVML